MASEPDARIEIPGLKVELRRTFMIGSLRYFNASGPFEAALRDVLGGPLPAPLKAERYSVARDEILLAWRSPTETWIMTEAAEAFVAIAARAGEFAAAGCLVDQTGGFRVWQASGNRTSDLLRRLGSAASVPALGDARTSRVAELPVLTLCVRESHILLVVERVYSDHLLGWMSESAADL